MRSRKIRSFGYYGFLHSLRSVEMTYVVCNSSKIGMKHYKKAC